MLWSKRQGSVGVSTGEIWNLNVVGCRGAGIDIKIKNFEQKNSWF